MACNLSFRDGKIATTITLKRDNIITLINSAQGIAGTVSDSDLPIEVEDVAFIEPDRIKLTGYYGMPGSTRVEGEIELTFSIVDEKPKVEITWVNIPGLDLASDFVKDINETLSNLIQDQIDQNGSGAIVKSIYIQDEALKIDIEIPVNQQ